MEQNWNHIKGFERFWRWIMVFTLGLGFVLGWGGVYLGIWRLPCELP